MLPSGCLVIVRIIHHGHGIIIQAITMHGILIQFLDTETT
jgi:hypothetical protein